MDLDHLRWPELDTTAVQARSARGAHRPHQPLPPYRGRDESQRIVEPMSEVITLGITVRDVIEDDDRAAIAYELESADTAVGTKEAGDSDYGRQL